MSRHFFYRKYLECVDKIFQNNEQSDVRRAPDYIDEDTIVGFAQAIVHEASVLSDTEHISLDKGIVEIDREVTEFIEWVMDIRGTVDNAGIDPNRVRIAILEIAGHN